MKKSLRKKAIIVALAVSLCIPTVCTAQTPALVAEAAVVAPTGISIEAENGSATISWDAVSGAKTYALFMKDPAGNVTLVHNRITGTSYSFSGLKDGARYGFVLKAYTSSGWSGYSSTVWTTCNVVSKAPENVTVVPGDGEVTVSWSPSYAAQTYALFLKDTSGNVTLIHNRVNGTSYTVKGMKNGVRMGFVVKAYVNREWSSWSKVAWATPTEAKKVPENLKANVGNDKITLTWDSIQQAEKYAVYQKSRSGAVTLLNSNVKGNNYDITGFAKNEEIGFVVKAYVNGTWEGYSEVVWVTVTAASPTPIPKPTVTPVPIIGDDYRIDGDTLTLFGEGELEMTLSDGTKIWVLARDHAIKNIIVKDGITSIGDTAFDSCMDVVSIKLPKSLKRIGRYAFKYCQSLIDIDIPDGVQEIDEYAFYECISLKEIEIPEGITSLNKVFNRCESLEYVKLPESVTSLKGTFVRCGKLREIDLPGKVGNLDSTFSGCSSLEYIEIPSSVVNMNGTFEDCTSLRSVVVPELVYELDSTFSGCSSLEEVTLPIGIETMTYTFMDCTSLEYIKMPYWLKEMYATFYGCTNLTTIEGLTRVENIGSYTFADCKKLESFVYPAGVTKANLTAFEDCSSLTSITFTNNITGISYSGDILPGCDALTAIYAPMGSKAYTFFKGKGYVVDDNPSIGVVYEISGNKLLFSGIGSVEAVLLNGVVTRQLVQENNITEIVFGDGITSIGECAFSVGCSTIKTLKFGKGLTKIGRDAFNSCTGLTGATIPTNVNKIEPGAFYNCTSLEGVVLPSGLEYLGAGVFGRCTAIKNISLPASLKYLGADAFTQCSSLQKIALPSGLSEICEGTFEDCISLTSVSIPASVRTIGEVAFSGCESLEEIVIPEGVTTIKDWAFSDCIELQYVTFPASLTSIGEYVFDECDSLDTIFVYEDSYAELWAVWNDFEFEFIDGDDDDDDDDGNTGDDDDDDSDDGNIGEDDDDGDDGNTGDDNYKKEIGEIRFDNSWEEQMQRNDFVLSWSSTLTEEQEAEVNYTVIQVYRKYPDGTNEKVFDRQVNYACTEFDMNFCGGLYGVEVSYFDQNYYKVATGQTRFKTPGTILGFRINNVTEGEVSSLRGVVNTCVAITKITCVVRDKNTQAVELQQQVNLSGNVHKYGLYASVLDNKVLINQLKAGVKTAEIIVVDSDGKTIKAVTEFTVFEKTEVGKPEEGAGGNGLLFTDVTGSEWYYETLCEANQYGIISGNGSTAFNPQDNISLEEYLLWLYRAFDVDVTENSVLVKADKDNIISEADEFYLDCLSVGVDRKNAAVIAYRFAVIYGVELVVSEAELPIDVPILGETYITPISRMLDINVMSENEYGRFGVDTKVTRAVAATIAVRMYYRNQEALIRNTVGENTRVNCAFEAEKKTDFDKVVNLYYSFDFVRNTEKYLDSGVLTFLDEAVYYLYNVDTDMIFGTAKRKEIIKAALIDQYCVSQEKIDEDVESFFEQVSDTADYADELLDSFDFLSDDKATKLCNDVILKLAKVEVDAGDGLVVVDVAAKFAKSIISHGKVTGKQISELKKLRAVVTDEETKEIIDEIIDELENNFLAATNDILEVIGETVIDKGFDVLLEVGKKYGTGYIALFEFAQTVSNLITGAGAQAEAGHKLRALIETSNTAKSTFLEKRDNFVFKPSINTLNEFCTAINFFVTTCETCINLSTIQNTDRFLIWSNEKNAKAYGQRELEKLDEYREFLKVYGR